MSDYRKRFVWLLSAAAMFITSGCSPVKTLNALIPSDAYQLQPAIAYGELPRQRLDLYLPRQPDAGTPPVVLFFYGGSWDSGNRGDYKFVAEALAAAGFAVVIPDYRVYPEVLFAQIMQDAAKAAQWVKTHAAAYNVDPDRVFLAGHSAGAHIAAMLSLDQDYLAAQGASAGDFRGMIGLAGPYDFLPLQSQRLKLIFGPPSEQWRSQPINFVSGQHPPMLLLVGDKDDKVWPRNSYRLADKIRAAGGSVKVVTYPGWGHIDMVAKLARPLRGDGELLQPIVDFIRSH